jgi:hypothetical protein
MNDRLHYTPVRRTVRTTVLGPLLLAATLLAGNPGGAQAQPGDYTFTPIAFLGGPTPGGGNFTSDFEPSAINNRGEVAFTADLIEPGQEGVFLAHRGELTELLRFGQPAPGGGTFSVGELGTIGLNDEGDAAVAFTLEPLQYAPFVNGGIYRYSHQAQTLTPVVIPGTPAPEGGTFLGVDFDLSLNNRGTISFVGYTGAPDNPVTGAYEADRKGHITTVVDVNTAAPGGGTFNFLAVPRLNDRGDVVFQGRVSPAIHYRSIYVRERATGKIVPIGRVGDPVPGGGVMVTTAFPLINDRGDVAFLASLAFDPTTVFNPTVLLLHHHHSLQRIAGPGDLMPGGGRVTFISALDWNVGLNNHGELAFATGLDNGEEGLYTYFHGSIHLVAKTGTVIPGVGTIFSLEMGNPIVGGAPPAAAGWPTSGSQLNDHGQTVFGCTLTDGRGVLLLATPGDDDDD